MQEILSLRKLPGVKLQPNGQLSLGYGWSTVSDAGPKRETHKRYSQMQLQLKRGEQMDSREYKTNLPKWLNDLIFDQLGASYSPGDTRYQYTRDLKPDEVKVYLGTYFPRSYCEAFCIAENLFRNTCYRSFWNDKLSPDTEINILDIGCGSGGEIIGLLDALRCLYPSFRINIYAFDGNQASLNCMKLIAGSYKARFNPGINGVAKFQGIDSEPDFLSMANDENVRNTMFDFILCCKTCSELMDKKVITSPFQRVAETFSGLLTCIGLMLIIDVTLKSGDDVWLPYAMNGELNSFARSQNAFSTLIPKPCGKHPQCCCNCYTKQIFNVSHSKASCDTSKVCYRVICWNFLRELMIPDSVMNVRQIIDPDKYFSPRNESGNGGVCCHSGGSDIADAFNINLTPAEIPRQPVVLTGLL